MSLQQLSGGSHFASVPCRMTSQYLGPIARLCLEMCLVFCLLKLLGVEALCLDELAKSKSSSRILIISLADCSSHTALLNSNFNLIQHSHSNLLSSGVHEIWNHIFIHNRCSHHAEVTVTDE